MFRRTAQPLFATRVRFRWSRPRPARRTVKHRSVEGPPSNGTSQLCIERTSTKGHRFHRGRRSRCAAKAGASRREFNGSSLIRLRFREDAAAGSCALEKDYGRLIEMALCLRGSWRDDSSFDQLLNSRSVPKLRALGTPSWPRIVSPFSNSPPLPDIPAGHRRLNHLDAGRGAKRAGAARADRAIVRVHRICQRSDSLDLNGNRIARVEPSGRVCGHSDSMWCSGENDGAGKQSRAAAQKFYQRGTSKIMSPVLQSWTISPLRLVRMARRSGWGSHRALPGRDREDKRNRRIFPGSTGRRPSFSANHAR